MGATDDSPDGIDRVTEHLAHFGVVGMRWGQRKARKAETSSDAKASIAVREKAKSHSVKALTNAQLKTAMERMQLEQNFKRLAINEKSGVSRFIASTLSDIGKREIQAVAAKKVAGFVAKKVATGGVG